MSVKAAGQRRGLLPLSHLGSSSDLSILALLTPNKTPFFPAWVKDLFIFLLFSEFPASIIIFFPPAAGGRGQKPIFSPFFGFDAPRPASVSLIKMPFLVKTCVGQSTGGFWGG